MKPFSLSVSQYREAKIRDALEKFGFADEMTIEEEVTRYAKARQLYKQELQRRQGGGNFNPFTNDPNCKSCGKK